MSENIPQARVVMRYIIIIFAAALAVTGGVFATVFATSDSAAGLRHGRPITPGR